MKAAQLLSARFPFNPSSLALPRPAGEGATDELSEILKAGRPIGTPGCFEEGRATEVSN